MQKYEIMEQSILKNLQELSDLCVEKGITDAYELMEILEKIIIKRRVEKSEKLNK